MLDADGGGRQPRRIRACRAAGAGIARPRLARRPGASGSAIDGLRWPGAPLGSSADVAVLLADLGVTAELIDAPERAAELEANVALAVEQGVFGAPSFVTEGGLLFFGNDRLDFLRRALAA